LGIKNAYGDVVLKDVYSPVIYDRDNNYATSNSVGLVIKNAVDITTVTSRMVDANEITAGSFKMIRGTNFWTPEESKIKSVDSIITESINAGAKIISSNNDAVSSTLVIAPEYIGMNTENIRMPKIKDGFLTVKDGKLESVNTQNFSLPIVFNTSNYGGTVPSFLIFEDTDITNVYTFTVVEGTYKLFGTFGFTDEVVLSIVDENLKTYFKQEGKSIHINNYITYLPTGKYKISVTSNIPSVYLKNQTNFITIES
jgi:hypothetical protein